MIEPPAIPNDQARLEALAQYELLDAPSVPALDELVELTAALCEVPICLISLISRDRQWLTSRVGLETCETSRGVSFCGHAIADDGLFLVRDAQLDPRFARNPLVTGEPHIRFYAGVPLVNAQGFKLGTLCVIDRKPRDLSADQRRILNVLAKQVMSQMELRLTMLRLNEEVERSRTAEQDAERANALKSRFLATMTHEIRTPLSIVIGFAEHLAKRLPDDQAEAKRWAEAILDAGKHTTTLINSVLDLAKAEAGGLQFEQIETDLHQLLHEMSEMFSDSAREKALTLQSTISDTVPRQVLSDPTRLRQALINMIGNALKFTAKGGVDLDLSFEAAAGDAPGMVHVEVRDTGCGIPADRIEQIFEPYIQATDATTRTHGGTGLGLAISREIARGLGGDLTCESTIDQGSTFRLSIPIPPAAS